MTRTGQLSIVLLDVEPPYELVSEYRAGRGMQDDRKGLGMGLIKEDEKGMSPLVLTCRGGRIRTCDPLVPNQMR